jgi:cytochrome c oxidase subunit 1
MSTVSRPAADRQPRISAETGIWSWITTVDHKRIGILYMLTFFFGFAIGGVEAFIIRLQLAYPGNTLVTPETYDQLFTMHGLTMIFAAVMPLSTGIANYVVPLQIGARDVAFPRLNALSFWITAAGFLFLNSSWFLGGAPNDGWFNYAPISTTPYDAGRGIDFYVLGVLMLGAGTLMAAINFLVTILNLRAPGMTFLRLPLFTWAIFVMSLMVLFAFPPLTADVLLLLFDRWYGTGFFLAPHGGNDVLWQHLFWIFGHPEVYIIMLPAFGILSDVIPTFARKPIFGYTAMVFATLVIGFLGFMTWSHHMFTVGQGPVVNSVFAVTTLAFAVPTGVKIFTWIGTMWGGRIRFTTAMLWAVSVIPMFTVGGLSGLMHAIVPSDFQQHDTYFVVAHIHYVLVGGTLFALLAGLYYWWPKVTGKLLDERIGRWSFWITLVGFNVTFFPMHFIGLLGMPRRVYTYPASLGLGWLNLLSTAGAFVLAAGLLLFVFNVFYSVARGRQAGADPWDARTLEWSVPSPPPAHNFDELPLIRGRDPLWVEKLHGDGHMLPAAAAGPDGVHLPSPTWVPAFLALGALVASYGFLYRGHWVTALGAAMALYALFRSILEDDPGVHVHPHGGAQSGSAAR